MFTDLDKNKEMLLGSYKKLKSYYHYNKNFVFMKKKIAELEADESKRSIGGTLVDLPIFLDN